MCVSMTSMSAERRKNTRINFNTIITLLAGVDEALYCQLIDISLKGACIEIPDEWRAGDPQKMMGTQYSLEIPLAEDLIIKMSVTVKRINNKLVGLHCDEIDLDSMTHLKHLLELNSGSSELIYRELADLFRE